MIYQFMTCKYLWKDIQMLREAGALSEANISVLLTSVEFKPEISSYNKDIHVKSIHVKISIVDIQFEFFFIYLLHARWRFLLLRD